jgi:hypothetical protein
VRIRNIFFCDYCGDVFGCQDALERHRRSQPPACLDVIPETAAAKRELTEKEHGRFKEKLERWMRTNEDIGTPLCADHQEDVSGFFEEREQAGESP